MSYSSSQNIPTKLNIERGNTITLNGSQYEVAKQLGEGGFGGVYSIMDTQKSVYALKIVELWKQHPQDYDSLRNRARMEYSVGQLFSPHIVKSYHTGAIEGNPFIIMEYCPNGTLVDHLLSYNSDADYKDFCRQILAGLKEMHNNYYIHRDIKPENIIVGPDNNLKLVDFGIATNTNHRLTRTNFFGTPNEHYGSVLYAPPEQLDGSKYFKYTKPSMDLYAFGTTLYYLLSGGHYPFGSAEDFEQDIEGYKKRKELGNINNIARHNPQLSNIWSEFLERCLQKDPKIRFQNCSEALQYLGIGDTSLKLSSNLDPIDYDALVYKGEFSKLKPINLREITDSKKNGTVLIGRLKDEEVENDIIIDDNERAVSRVHCTIEKVDDDWFLRDGQFIPEKLWKQSKHGTKVNDIELKDTKDGIKLENGDHIIVGTVKFEFVKNSEG